MKKETIYTEIATKILEQLEKGVAPWRKPWTQAGTGKWAVSYSTGKPYSFINQFMLDLAGGEWLTFHQVKELGGKVKKGQRGKRILSWAVIKEKANENEQEGEEQRERTFIRAKWYTVFEISQCEGIERKRTEEPEIMTFTNERIEAADLVANEYIEREGIEFAVDDTINARAFFRPSEDLVNMPAFERFESAAEYYSTLFHELTHSTGHANRLNRLEPGAVFGSNSYGKEELVAEMGACMALAKLDISTEGAFNNSAGYCDGWLKSIKADAKEDMEKAGRLIVSAAANAEKAVKLIFNEETANE